MKRPKSLRIMGHRVKVRFIPFDETNPDWGDFDGDAKLITIVDAPNWRETLLHEKIHAILFFSGVSQLLDEKTEEAIVTAVTSGLL